MATRQTETDRAVFGPLADVEAALETEPELVVALERNRGWLSLMGHIGSRRERKEKVLLAAVMRADEPVDQREIDYLRGYFDALDWMAKLPERMRTKLREDGESNAE
jgi:hypothetical protein